MILPKRFLALNACHILRKNYIAKLLEAFFNNTFARKDSTKYTNLKLH